jgi:hypothetical protein
MHGTHTKSTVALTCETRVCLSVCLSVGRAYQNQGKTQKRKIVDQEKGKRKDKIDGEIKENTNKISGE